MTRSQSPTRTPTRWIWFFLSSVALSPLALSPLALSPVAIEAQVTTTPSPPETAPSQNDPENNDAGSENRGEGAERSLNANFLNPEMNVEEWVERFEGESREIFAGRRAILSAMQLRPGLRVADVGAGTGFFSRLFAKAVGDRGWVYAVDISPAFLSHIASMNAAHNVSNLTPVMGTASRVCLPPASVDLVFICDTYHHFEAPESTMRSIADAMTEGGDLYVIDFERIPGVSRDWVLGHVRAGKSVFRSEIEAAGFAFVGELDIAEFSENYALHFRKRRR